MSRACRGRRRNSARSPSETRRGGLPNWRPARVPEVFERALDRVAIAVELGRVLSWVTLRGMLGPVSQLATLRPDGSAVIAIAAMEDFIGGDVVEQDADGDARQPPPMAGRISTETPFAAQSKKQLAL